MKHQRRGWQQIPKIGEKSECERNFNIASKTACRGFKSFCPCHHQGSLQTPTVRRLRAFFMPKSPEWTRSIDTGLPWQNPPNAPIFVNVPTAAVRYIIKKASVNFGKRTVLYRVPRMGDWREEWMDLFFQPCCVCKQIKCLTVVGCCDSIYFIECRKWKYKIWGCEQCKSFKNTVQKTLSLMD